MIALYGYLRRRQTRVADIMMGGWVLPTVFGWLTVFVYLPTDMINNNNERK